MNMVCITQGGSRSQPQFERKRSTNMLAPSTISLPGVSFAFTAAVLFGASTPLSKLLLREVDPILLAGLLYLGSGSGLAL